MFGTKFAHVDLVTRIKRKIVKTSIEYDYFPFCCMNGFILFENCSEFFCILNAYYSNKVFLFPSLPVFLELKLMIVAFLHVVKDCHHGTHYKLCIVHGVHQAYSAWDSFFDGILNNYKQMITFISYSKHTIHIFTLISTFACLYICTSVYTCSQTT